MGKLEPITRAVEQLTPYERARFRVWFEQYEARLFDDQIEQDAKAGKLDKLLAEVRERHRTDPHEEL
jgi:hypothetical protein